MNKFLITALVFFLVISSSSAQAVEETDSSYFKVESIDGIVVVGQIVGKEADHILVKTSDYGVVKILLSNVESMTRVAHPSANQPGVLPYVMQSSRYFISANGYGLREGEAYYQNGWIFFNQFSYGFSDHFSVGAGIVPFFLFDAAPSPIWIVPKVSIPIIKDKLNFGAGALVGGIPGEGAGGVMFGHITVGSRDRNVSFGLGKSFESDLLSDDFTYSLSAALRLNQKWYLLSENYMLDEIGIISIGGRRMINRFALDFGLFVPTNAGGFFGTPWLSISAPLGKKE